MSDFDREAEREKLREKYENDQQARETTEKMSELLLQGATMTNAHCSQCNDPIFRYDGQEFCATCERPVDRGDGAPEAGDGGQEASDGDDSAREQIQVTSPDDDARVAFGGRSDGEENGADAAADSDPIDPQPGTARQPEQSRSRRADSRGRDEAPDSRRRPGDEGSPGSAPTPGASTPAGGADVPAARESLLRTLARFSRAAEGTEDPQRAREYLAAAREAAEALAALRQ
ncbi:MAG: Sjogren's syndrome/scleroderma autoantigen 1 family protein [Halovenus sp.]